MMIRQYDIWLADLSPRMGTEPGKTRPVVIIQTDLLNPFHPSTVICPVTSRIQPAVKLLRVHLQKGQLDKPSAILVDQLRAIDNRRLKQRLGALTLRQIKQLKQNLLVVLDL
jgi:mRNA interferase MazF